MDVHVACLSALGSSLQEPVRGLDTEQQQQQHRVQHVYLGVVLSLDTYVKQRTTRDVSV